MVVVVSREVVVVLLVIIVIVVMVEVLVGKVVIGVVQYQHYVITRHNRKSLYSYYY